jgi:phasin family protein
MTATKANTGQKTKTAHNPYPMFDVDMSKVLTAFDPGKFADEFAKMAERYQVPGFDVEALGESHRRNVEALTAANRTATEGARALAKRQAAILQETMDVAKDAFGQFGQFGKSGSPQDVAAKQVAIAKQVFETAVANAQELSEMVAKSNAETADVITGRIAEGFDEIKVLAEKLKK